MSLSGNTEKINELLSKINALPEAGSGGEGGSGVETCTVTMTADFFPYSGTKYFWYCAESGYASETVPKDRDSVSIQCVVPSIVSFGLPCYAMTTSGGAEVLAISPGAIVYVTGDATITLPG